MKPRLWLVLATFAVTAAACSSERRTSGEASAATGAAAPPAKTAVRDAGPVDAPRAELKQHMSLHFAAVSELQRAIVRGYLDEAKKLARWILEHSEKVPEKWQPFVDELHAAAREVAGAPDLPTAGRLAARLGRACSRCHEDLTAVVSFTWSPAPDDEPVLRTQMLRHQWAAARLWEGLVGPSDEMWTQGATVLASTRLDLGTATTAAAAELDRADVSALTAKVRELATRAGQLAEQDARARLYGDLLVTCASCHQLVRPRPAPGP